MQNTSANYYPELEHQQTSPARLHLSNGEESPHYLHTYIAKMLLHDLTFSHAFRDVPSLPRYFPLETLSCKKSAPKTKKKMVKKEKERRRRGTNANRGNLTTIFLPLTDALVFT